MHCLWAKSGEQGGHGLLAHMLDVAAVAETILSYEPSSTLHWIAEGLGLPVAQVMRWIAFLAGLHDFGKAIPGFQNKWPQGRQADEAAGLIFKAPSLEATDHARASAVLLQVFLMERLPQHEDWVRHVLQAISAHHGYNFSKRELEGAKPRFESPEWAQARRALFDAYSDVLAPQGEPAAEALSLQVVQWLAGLTSVADWIGSNTEWFPLGGCDDDLRVYYRRALARAEKALQAIGWAPHQILLDTPADSNALISRIVGQPGALEARSLQREADALLNDVQGPALLLVEAPMGEGKTELAFLAHLRLHGYSG